MKKVRFLSLISFVGLVLFGFIFTFNSCEIGLGASVDTQAPVVSFAETTVGSGGVIRDSFMVYGNWTDDGTIKEVTATLNKTDGSKVSFETKGKVETTENGSGTWNAVFDPPKDKIPDGSYELSITMEDKGNHKSTITRAVIIDNTPPLVVLTRPGTKLNDTSFDSYGQKFSLEGKAADDNDVSLVEVNIFEDAACTKLLKTIPIPNVPLTIDLDVAEFSATELNDYAEIYKILKDGLADKKGGTAYRYCTLTIYDGAQRYPADGSAQTEADQKGNQTNTYYVNDDEIAKLFTEYKITELYHILNESFGSSAGRAISVDSVKTKLEQQAITSSQFTINPENSPTFVVNSRSPLEIRKNSSGDIVSNLDLDAKYYITSGSSSLQVEISAGLDKHAIEKDTVGIYLKECTENGVEIESANPIWLVEPVTESNPNAHAESLVEIIQSGTTFKFTTKKNDNGTITSNNYPGLEVDHYYKIGVVGKDVKGNDILSDDIYAFKLTPNSDYIELTVSATPEWLSTTTTNNAYKQVNVRLSYSGGDASSYTVYEKRDNEDNDDITADLIWNNEDEAWHRIFSVTPSNKPSTLVYRVEGDNASYSSNKTITLKYDDIPPQIVKDASHPLVSPSPNDTESPSFQFSGYARDTGSGVDTVHLQIGTEDIPVVWTSEKWEINIKKADYLSSIFEHEGEKTVKVYTVDKVGLSSTPSVDDGTQYTWIYDTSVPDVKITQYKIGSEEPENISSDLIVGTPFTLSGIAADNYGIKSIKITQKKGNATVEKVLSLTNGKWSVDLPLQSDGTAYTSFTDHSADGEYTFTVTAVDNANKPNTAVTKITLNTKAPTVTIKSPTFTNNESAWQLSNTVMISGTASSPATVSGIFYKLLTANDPVPSKPTDPAAEGWAEASGTTNWAFNLNNVPDSATNKIYVTSIDSVGNVSDIQTRTLKVDSTAPELQALYYNFAGTTIYEPAEGQIYVDGEKDLIVYGKYLDNGSGVKALTFKMKNVSITPTISYSTGTITGDVTADKIKALSYSANNTLNTTPSTAITYWKATIAKASLTSAAVGDFMVSGSNGSGSSVGPLKAFGISFDNKKPIISNVQFTTTAEAPYEVYKQTSSDDYYVNNQVTGVKFAVSGIATDNCGVKDVTLTIGGTARTRTSDSVGEWEFANINLSSYGESDTPKAIITVTDVAGKTETHEFTIHFDNTKPLAKHFADTKHKDIYFRIGAANNDTLSTDSSKVESGEAWNDSLDKDVGSKYSFGSFGNDSTIEIRGTFKEEGAGLKTIYYKISTTAPTSTEINNYKNGTLPEGAKEFAPLETPQKRRVTYNTSVGKKSIEIESNYRVSLPGFNAENNYLILIAQDKVGNRNIDLLKITDDKNADDTIKTEKNDQDEDVIVELDSIGDSKWNSADQNTENSYYGLNKDITVPNITTNITQGVFTNTVQPVTVSGTAGDALAGLSSVKVYIDEEVDKEGGGKIKVEWSETKKAPDGYIPGTSYNWSVEIPASTFANVKSGTSLTAYATAKDKAGIGNEKTISAATITIDTDAPTVEINTPADADTSSADVDVNGTITVSGTADDVYGVGKILGMCYKIADSATKPGKETPAAGSTWSAPSGWIKISTFLTDENATTNWTFQNINTANLSGSAAITNGSKVWFTIAVQDKAGNVGYATPQKVIVDQNTDRPVIKFTNLTNVAASNQTPVYILKFGDQSKLEGNISDDDGSSTAVVDTFVVSKTKLTAAPTNGSDGWTKTTDGNEITWSYTYTEDGNSYTERTKYNKTTGDYTYTPGVTADGPKEVYFFVKDNKGTIFYTAHGTEFNQPYQQYKAETSTKTSNANKLEYKSDGTSPTISDVKLVLQYEWQAVKTQQNATTIYFTNSACTTKATDSTADSTIVYKKVDPGTGTVVGGTKENKVIFLIKAADANGIKNMNLKYTPAGGAERTITSSSGTFTATTTNAEATWITEEIPVSDFDTGSVNVAITAYDQSDLFANQNPVFMVDNTAPTINISSPGPNDEVTGEVSIAGQATDEGGAGNPTINFLIPTSAQKTAQAASGKTDLEYYKTLPVSAGNWIGKIAGEKTPAAFEYLFNGNVNDNASLDIYTKSDTSNTYGLTADSEGIYSVPIYFRSQDALGNINVIKFTAKYNPDADKPKTEISYPSAANYQGSNQFVTLGGTIRVTGSVTIPSLSTTPEKVYIQISDDDGNFDSDDKTKAINTYQCTVKTVANVASDIGKTVTGFTTTALSDAWWGIEAVRSSNAWSYNLNQNGKLNVTTGDKINKIKIRACAVNAEGKMGAWSEPVAIHIDASAPEYTTKLYQFTNKPTAQSHTPIAEKDYEPGIFLKGEWYLGINMTDTDKVVIETIERDSAELPENSDDVVKLFTNGNKNLDLYIKLTSAASQTYKISARDDAEGNYHYVYPTYEIKVDNEAPTLGTIKTGEGYPLSMTKQRTSNKVITFGATASDEGSGFSRLAYYFKRDTSIELPLPAVNNANLNEWTIGSAYTGTTLTEQDDLYGVTLAGTREVSGENTIFTSTNAITAYTFIRKGALVKIAGTYHLITAVDVTNKKVTVSGKIESTVTSAFFPAAFIVDNLSSEGSEWENGINTMKNDDGDGIVESVKKAGATWTWDTSVYAGELDDGQITLVCVAFDVAENSAKSETTFMLTNKTPRISKLYLATDLNGNEKFSDDELGTSVITKNAAKTVEKYYSALAAGNLQDVFTVYGNIDDENNSSTSSGITMRDKLGMAFEFISGYEGYGAGQGDLKYKLSIGSTKITTGESGTTGSLAAATDAKYDDTADSITNSIISQGLMSFEVPTSAVSSGTEDALNYLHVTLWDNANSAAGTKDGAKTSHDYTTQSGVTAQYDTYASFGAQWTAFNVPIVLDLVDGVAPVVKINDPIALGTEDVPQGHVDLKSTLTSLTGSNEFDSDDKVSGKIKFTGTITDEKRISNIKLTVSKGGNAINFSTKPITNVTLATYNATNGEFDHTSITPNGATGVTFTIVSSTFSTSTGHTVVWELEVDTEKVAGNAVANVLFSLTANDGTNDGNDTHQVDIVPYITSFKRSTTLTDTHRSKKGKYQVVLAENIDIIGFNFPDTAETVAGAIKLQVSGQEKLADGTAKASITPAAGYTVHSMTFTAPDTSGYIKVVTNGVSSVNNFNSGNEIANPDYSGVTCNDDIYLSVWKNDEYFAASNDPISPAMDRIAATKKNNNYNADVYTLYGGWATQGGKFFASYPGTTGNSANAPGPANGGGDNGTGSEEFKDPATFYDVVVDQSGNRYNILLDCWQGGSPARGWGQNFVLNRNGYYTHNTNGSGYSTNNSNAQTTNYTHVIERMGKYTLPENADSSDGYDDIFNQFLNPRLALNEGIVYLTYYDRYAKCLKYAVSKPIDSASYIEFKYSTEGMRNGGGNNSAGTFRKDGYTTGDCVVAGYDTLQSGGSKTNLDVGRWSAVVVDKTVVDDENAVAPVIAYYDATHRSLMLATASGNGNGTMAGHTTNVQKKSFPLNSNSPVLSGEAVSTTQGNAWNRVQVGDSSLRLGQYVSMVIDADGNLHIACNGAKGGNKLYYIYGEKSSYGSYSFTTTLVDAEGAGTWTDIQLEDTTASGTAAKPVISYYDPSNDSSENAVKVAYLDGGDWDTMTVPLASNAVSDRITLAVDVTDGASVASATTNNSKLAIGYVSNRFECVYLRKE